MLRKIILLALLAVIMFGVSLMVPLSLQAPKNGEPYVTRFMVSGSESDLNLKRNSAIWVSLQDINPVLLCAVIKAEDRKFFRHNGFDFISIYKVLLKWYREGHLIGASTITQQLAKNLIGNRDRTWKNKLIEAWYTIKLEYHHSKADILEHYLNSVEWGPDIWGIYNASKFYFSEEPLALATEESLFLASIISSPLSQSDDRQVKRMSSLFDRINKQMYLSGLYAHDKMIQINGAWSNLKSLSERKNGNYTIDLRSSDAESLRLLHAVDSECGLDLELSHEK